ncbi:hypothetical protein PM3016_4469 [Paenibacillus mucilaginosus 3016]|uniref:Uncharacterized protein n=2 Tax=Paenibacillus mucilaginosus TaxID=61624 RepID=H6NAX8_9BACL|nr:hypothetical protein [Paenibacillus mucilaginosus]AFC31233.1 hypothetical protein PM3016_4469 [Paenibacillus mucilaginosus 3016]AFH63552.1 hypothetical protein B2K_23120 [Paenibacillus mucilaginosus K02]WFA19798.1 hypothetical protein ERY13_22420 [Paenibacillus mucilaginosus]
MRWLLALGVGIEITGIVWDTLYHEKYGYDELYFIPPAHYLDLVGAPLLFITALLLLRKGKGTLWPYYGIMAGAVLQTIGWVWDNFFYHLRGIEPGPLAPPHLALNFGLLFMVLFTICAFIAAAVHRFRNKSGPPMTAEKGMK